MRQNRTNLWDVTTQVAWLIVGGNVMDKDNTVFLKWHRKEWSFNYHTVWILLLEKAATVWSMNGSMLCDSNLCRFFKWMYICYLSECFLDLHGIITFYSSSKIYYVQFSCFILTLRFFSWYPDRYRFRYDNFISSSVFPTVQAMVAFTVSFIKLYGAGLSPSALG